MTMAIVSGSSSRSSGIQHRNRRRPLYSLISSSSETSLSSYLCWITIIIILSIILGRPTTFTLLPVTRAFAPPLLQQARRPITSRQQVAALWLLDQKYQQQQQQQQKFLSRPSLLRCPKTGSSTRTVWKKMTTTSEDGHDSVDPVIKLGLPSPIILGSGSFTRKLILTEMNIKYNIIVRSIDEKGLGDRTKDDPSDLVLKLAKAKSKHLVNEIMNGNCCNERDKKTGNIIHINMEQLKDGTTTNGGYLVLTGDQVVTHNNLILEKPESIKEAKDFVSRYGQSPPSTVGSCVITHIPSMIQVSGVDTATIYFHKSIADTKDNKDLIDRLLEDNAPVLSCAGGLMIEHPYVKKHINYIDGTEDSVMGLSKKLVLELLDELATKLTEAK